METNALYNPGGIFRDITLIKNINIDIIAVVHVYWVIYKNTVQIYKNKPVT
jgi:hypothetical protein